MKNRLNGILVFALLTSCSTFATGMGIKLEHEVQSAVEAVEKASYDAPAPVKPQIVVQTK